MTLKSPRRRVRRVPLGELDAEDLAERSAHDSMEEVCRRIGTLAVATQPPTSPHKRRSHPQRENFSVFEDPCAVHGATHLLGARTRAMSAALVHDDKENQPP
ncbi:hypothetical protein MEQU1_001518 [Malassezia equina]|uniref:Uncharacterized protein n=1 Tax=Malassezia equina TaxID=1381935 RepID=A0AAF0EDW2_9BASI|nr:hypothetical protein MEQU1_001518 [Malassezia equina]